MKLPIWRRRQQLELDEEIEAHLRMAVEDRIAHGEEPDDARRAALREFGNVDLVKETTRDMWGWTSAERLVQDVRYGVRALRRSPGFATAALLTLALGIGANTLVFSIVNAVLLRPLPFPHPERLLAVSRLDVRPGQAATSGTSVSYPNFFDWRAANHAFEYLASYRWARLTLSGGGAAEQLEGAVVSSDFFRALGVRPVMGRDFRQDEERAGSDVAVISEDLWRSRFGAAPDIIGRRIVLNSRSFSIVGVLPARSSFPITVPTRQIWITISEDARIENPGDTPMTVQRGANFLGVIGRLRPAVSIDEARVEMNALAKRLARQYPDDNASGGGAIVVPELEHLVGGARFELLVLLAAAACLLLIACANIANLLLARGVGRARELVLRAALGASSARLARQLLTESLVLSLAGAGLGVLLAYSAIDVVVALSPTDVRGLDQVTVDVRVLAFAAVVAVFTTALFGAAPAMQAARLELAAGLKDGGRSGAGPRQHRLRDGFVVLQTALGVVLLVAAGLMLRSFANLRHAAPGFDPRGLLTVRVTLPDARYPYEKQVGFYDELFPVLGAVPGVTAVAGVAPLPLSGNRLTLSFEVKDRPLPPSERPDAEFAVVSPGYFRAMRIPLLRGREFTQQDGLEAPRVVVINESLARRYFPDRDPIGRQIKIGLRTTERETPWREIVGIASDVKLRRLSDEGAPGYYVPYAQGLVTSLNLAVRTNRSPSDVLADLRNVVSARDSQLAVAEVRTMEEYVARSMSATRFEALLLGSFSALGLVLAALGLYGVVTSSVAERTHEFGVRVALGASARDLLVAVLRKGCLLTAAGLGLGLALTAFTSRLLASVLYGVAPLDPATLAAVCATLMIVALAACWPPARRAVSVSPVTALRQE